MKKIYDRNEVTFAVLWIVAYCVIMTPLRGQYGDSSPWMLLGLAVFAAVILTFLRKYHLEAKYGLTGWPSDGKKYLYFLPILILATGNLWGGIMPAHSGIYQVCAVLSMALIGFVEEMIFRGFLFRGMLKSSGERWAILVSALTFGIGHIVNLFTGQTTMETAVQVPFAIAWGFMFTFAYYKSGSLLPCILAHAMIDIFAEFAVEYSEIIWLEWAYIIATIVIAVLYCLYLSRLETPDSRN